jgi:hypothetical protein
MKSDDLIRALAADLTPPMPLERRLLAGLLPAALVAVAAVWTVLGVRPDLGGTFGEPLSAARYALGLGLGAGGLWAALRLARPGRPAPVLAPVLAVAAVAAGLVVFALVATPVAGWGMAWVGKTMVACLVSIPLLAILPVAAVLGMLRSGAVTAPRRAGAMAGLAGGGIAAAAYALHCTEDSPLFYVCWYGIGILAVTAVSTLIAPRVLRW